MVSTGDGGGTNSCVYVCLCVCGECGVWEWGVWMQMCIHTFMFVYMNENVYIKTKKTQSLRSKSSN